MWSCWLGFWGFGYEIDLEAPKFFLLGFGVWLIGAHRAGPCAPIASAAHPKPLNP